MSEFDPVYILARDPDDDNEIIPCECCDSKVPTFLFDRPFRGTANPDGAQARLCEVCSDSFISNDFMYPSIANYDRMFILRNLAACTNMILERLKRIEEKLGMEQL